jgi:predicted transcriptional regulator
MTEQRKVADEEAFADRTVLDLLMDDDNQRPWAIEELVRELGDELAAVDALARLHGAGLVHRCEDVAWAARAAIPYRAIMD